MARYYSSDEVVKLLGITRNTLYAYVSRGLIRSEPDSRSRRVRRYHALDVDRLAKRGKDHKPWPEASNLAADRGAVILSSAITLLGEDTFYYRGRSVLTLAEQGSFEETIAVLWEPAGSRLGYPKAYVCDLVEETLRLIPKAQVPVGGFLSLLSMLDARDVKAFAFTPEATAQAGIVMVDGLLRILAGDWRKKGVAKHLAKCWGVDQGNGRLLDAVLTLVADHELDMSAFVARCTASAGCSPYSAVAAATHVFFGRRQEGKTESVYGLLREADSQGSLYEVIVSRVRRGDPVPGFGSHAHDFDPRADYLLHCLPDHHGYVKQAFAAAKELLNGAYPTIDFALLLVERDLSLPAKSGAYLFYLGRLVGWVAHVMEQYIQGQTIQPRAKYVGQTPQISISLPE